MVELDPWAPHDLPQWQDKPIPASTKPGKRGPTNIRAAFLFSKASSAYYYLFYSIVNAAIALVQCLPAEYPELG